VKNIINGDKKKSYFMLLPGNYFSVILHFLNTLHLWPIISTAPI